MVGDSYSREDIPRLPRTFLEAFDLLATSAAARSCIGEETVMSYLEILGREREILLRTATDWERTRYLSSI